MRCPVCTTRLARTVRRCPACDTDLPAPPLGLIGWGAIVGVLVVGAAIVARWWWRQ